MEKEGKDNIIYVGGKPFMNYVTGIVMQFTTKEADEVIVKARGRYISRAVDIVEVAKKRFLEDKVEIDNIEVDSEEFKNDDGKNVRVSTIDLFLKKIKK